MLILKQLVILSQVRLNSSNPRSSISQSPSLTFADSCFPESIVKEKRTCELSEEELFKKDALPSVFVCLECRIMAHANFAPHRCGHRAS